MQLHQTKITDTDNKQAVSDYHACSKVARPAKQPIKKKKRFLFFTVYFATLTKLQLFRRKLAAV